MRYKFTNSRKWGNKKTFLLTGFGEIIFGIRGFIFSILLNKKKYQKHIDRLKNIGIELFNNYYYENSRSH